MSIAKAHGQECLCYQKPTAGLRKIARAWAKRGRRNQAAVVASMTSCAWMLTMLLAMVAIGAPQVARAQSSRKDDIVFNAQGRPMAGATVRICTASATGQPCTPLANIYSDPGMTQALANPITTDGLGNYTFYAVPGRYEVEISGPNITTKQLPNVLLPSDPTNPTFATISTTSGISAFSLALGGNLTVAGNTAITGTLTVGGVPVTGGAGGSPGGSTTQLQYNNSGAFAGAAGVITNGTSVNIEGPTPHTDASVFGARAIHAGGYWDFYNSCTASSTTISLFGAGSFANGDGISAYGCGATNTMSTPGAPTVTPSQAAHATGLGIDVNAPAGSTSYSYKVVALGAWSATPSSNLWGAYTAASAAGTTTTGDTLGSQSQTVSTVSIVPCTVALCNSTRGGVETVTCSSACPVSPGAYISLYGTSNDIAFSTENIVLAVNSPTSFTFVTGINTTASGTGGTVAWFNCNHLTWSAVTGAFEYAIYGRTSGSWMLLGYSLGTTFDDFGATMTANAAPYQWLLQYDGSTWVPTPPASAQNGVLTTTIVSGAGTTTLIVANAATNSASGWSTPDSVPALRAAANYAVTNGGPLFIPCVSTTSDYRYIVGSYLQLTTGPLNVQQCGSLYLDAPMEWDAFLNWFGDATGNNNQAASNGLVPNAEIDVDTAYPGIYAPSATSMFIDHTYLSQIGGSNMALLSALFNGGPGMVWQNSVWETGGTNFANDYMGIGLLTSNLSDNTFTNDSWGAGPNQVPNASTTPTVAIGHGGQLHIDNCTFNKRGIAEFGTAQLKVSKGCWAQGMITPFVMTNVVTADVGGSSIDGILMDTSGQPIFDVLSTLPLQGSLEIRSANNDFPYNVVTGSGVANLHVWDLGIPGQNQDYTYDSSANTMAPAELQGTSSAVLEFSKPVYQAQPNPQAFFIEQSSPAPGVSVSSGGSLPVGINTYVQTTLYSNGWSRESGGTNATTTTGNQTVTVTGTAMPGARGYSFFNATRGGVSNSCYDQPTPTCTDTGGGGLKSAGAPPNAPMDGCPSLNANGIFTCDGPVYSTVSPSPLTDSSTVSLAVNGNKGNPWYTLGLSTNTTLNVSGMVTGQQIRLFVTQPPSGGPYTVTLGTGCVWQTGTIAWSTAPSATDLLAWWYDGTNCWTLEGPLNGPPLQTYYITPGYAGNTLAATANATVCSGFVVPAGGVSAGHIWLNLSANDNTNNSDFGIYNKAGTLLAHIGAQHTASTGGQEFAFASGTTTFPAGKAYACLTSAGATIALEENSNSPSFYNSTSVGSTTSGGALNGSITPPADGFSVGNQWEFMLVP